MHQSQLDSLSSLHGLSLPFRDAIFSLYGKQVMAFSNDGLLDKIKSACTGTIERVNASDYSGRINEYGTHVEGFFLETCIAHGLNYGVPTGTDGAAKSSGYPDGLLVVDDFYYYIEIKTCSQGSKGSAFRSFYFSPSTTPKVVHDACHLLIGFETVSNAGVHRLSGNFELLDLYELQVKIKVEFNASNKDLYQCQLSLLSDV